MLPPLTIAMSGPDPVTRPREGRRDGRSPGRFGDNLGSREQPEDGVDDLVILHRDHLVDVLLRVREGQVARPDRHQPVGNTRGLVERDGMPLRQRRLHRRGSRWLDPDHADGGLGLFDGRRHTGQQAAAADRHEDGFHVRPLLQQFQAQCALAGDDPLVIERRHHRQPAFRRFLFGPRLPISRGGAGEDDLGTETAGALHLDRRRCGWHHDDRRGAQFAGRERHGLAVVAG